MIEPKDIDADVIRGTVYGVQRWSDTHVGSSGGGGYVGTHGGHVSAAQVHSDVVQRQSFFMKCEDGKDRQMNIESVSVADGHQLTIGWIGSIKEDLVTYVYIRNETTRQTDLRKFPVLKYPTQGVATFWLSVVSIFVLPVLFAKLLPRLEIAWPLGLLCGVCLTVVKWSSWMKLKTNTTEAAIDLAVEKLNAKGLDIECVNDGKLVRDTIRMTAA